MRGNRRGRPSVYTYDGMPAQECRSAVTKENL
jgi:hypothetical protein